MQTHHHQNQPSGQPDYLQSSRHKAIWFTRRRTLTFLLVEVLNPQSDGITGKGVLTVLQTVTDNQIFNKLAHHALLKTTRKHRQQATTAEPK